MRIVFPTDEDRGYLSKRGAHFGKAKFYTVVTLKDGAIEDVEVVKNGGHGSVCANAVANILALHPDALVVSGMGPTPAANFAKSGLAVYIDKISATVEESLKLLAEGELEKNNGEGTCDAKK